MIRCWNSSRGCKEGRKNRILIVEIERERWKEARWWRWKDNRRRSRMEGMVKFRWRRSLICHSFKQIKYWVNCYRMIELREKVQQWFIMESLERLTLERWRRFLTKVWQWRLIRVYLILKPQKQLRLELQVKRQVDPNTIHILAAELER
mgnify:CR=1 FL=1